MPVLPISKGTISLIVCHLNSGTYKRVIIQSKMGVSRSLILLTSPPPEANSFETR